MKSCRYQLILCLCLFLFLAGTMVNCSEATTLGQWIPPSAAFQIIRLHVSPLEAKVGENITVAVEVWNNSANDGNYQVELKVNDVIEAQKRVHIGGYSTKAASFLISRDKPGIYTITAGELHETLLIVKDLPNSKLEVLGENVYNVKCRNIIGNNGTGTIATVLLRMALITSREPYQKVVLTKASPDIYTVTEDECGNRFAEFQLTNIRSGKEVSVEITYQVIVGQLRYQLDSCEGTIPKAYLKPERYIESDNPDIIALAKQITQDKLTYCEKATAIYDWIGDNIDYSTSTMEDKGALYCLNERSGDCTEFACLYIALCRAAGIPARLIEGLVSEYHAENMFHDWAEIYLPGIGWMPVDATLSMFKEYREQTFTNVAGENIIIAMGDFRSSGKFVDEFRLVEYIYSGDSERSEAVVEPIWQVEEAKEH